MAGAELGTGVAGFLVTKSFHQHLPTMTEHGPLMQLAVVFLVSGM